MTTQNLIDENSNLKSLNKSLESQLSFAMEEIRALRHRHFGKSSESSFNQGQEVLPGLELPAPIEDERPEIRVSSHTKKKPIRKPLPNYLPREEKIIDIPEFQKICPIHHEPLKKIGEERSEELHYVPATAKVVVTIRPKYASSCCEVHKILVAPVVAKLIPKSFSSPSLLAQIAISKYMDHLPLYRQEDIFARLGIELKRQTMAEWMIKFGEAARPLYNLLQDKLLARPYIGCDETPFRVLNANGEKVKSQHYMWVRGCPGDWGQPILLFEYGTSRRAAVAKEILSGFCGHLQVDQYVGYDWTEVDPNIIRVACLAHIRRKFFEAQKITKTKGGIPGKVLALIEKVYKIEDEILLLDQVERTKARREKAEPILSEIKDYLEAKRASVPPQGKIGKAITYALNAWPNLLNYLADWRIRPDNNFIENAIRPFALGRKNWLFCDSNRGAQASSVIYSLIETAKVNDLDVQAYLQKIITDLPLAVTVDDFEKLLPLA